MKKTFQIDSNVFIIVRWASFLMASAVSALLNLFLFSSLDSSWTWLLISMSLCLEGTKISTLLTRNCFASIFAKVKKASIKAKQHTFFILYLLLATLSIIAGLGFSITITAKTQASQSISLATMKAQYQTLVQQIEKIDTKKLEISELNKSVGISIDSYGPFISANQKYQEAEAKYVQANTAYRSAIGNRQLKIEGTPEYDSATKEINSSNQLLLAAQTERSLAKTERDRIQTNFNDFQKSSEVVEKRLNEDLLVLNQELKILISQCGLSSEIGSVALLELDNKIKEETNKNIIEKGMTFMFEEFAKYLKTTPEYIKLFILLFVAIMVELTIWQCGPSIRITRNILYFFRSSIPSDVDVNEILDVFDKENQIYSDMKLDIIQKPIIKEKRKYQKRKIKTPTVTLQSEVPVKQSDVVETTSGIVQPTKPQEVSELVQYRFGKTTSLVKDTLISLIKRCINEPGPFNADPSSAARELDINDRTRDVILNRLSTLTLGNKPLIQKNKYGEWIAFYDYQKIIDYATEVES